MVHRLEFQHWVHAPVERVFRFFANPGNLPRIMPPESRTELLRVTLAPPPGIPAAQATITDQEPLAGTGSEVLTSFRLIPFLPVRGYWTARIVEFEWNRYFVDVQEKGPFRSFRHRHETEAEVREGVCGTLVRDVIDYEVGWGVLGGLARRFFVEPQIRKTFAYRQRALEKLMAATATK